MSVIQTVIQLTQAFLSWQRTHPQAAFVGLFMATFILLMFQVIERVKNGWDDAEYLRLNPFARKPQAIFDLCWDGAVTGVYVLCALNCAWFFLVGFTFVLTH